jgi:hypothetical protein
MGNQDTRSSRPTKLNTTSKTKVVKTIKKKYKKEKILKFKC